MSYILQTKALSKSYKNIEVVSNVNMNIERGEIYGFLGPNGAGKTTIMRMINNLVKPTKGEIEIFGEKLGNKSYEILKRMSGIIEYPVFYENLTAQDNLELHLQYMGFYDKKLISEALEMVGLKDIDKKVVKNFSLGMKQRLGIARAISTRPELIILDEPINGMDPEGIREIRQLFQMLSKEYKITILISSHLLQEIEQLADTIGVINKGKLIKEVSMEEVKGQHSEFIEVVTTNNKKASFILEDKLNLTNFKVIDDKTIRIYHPELSPVQLSNTLVLNDIGIEALNRKNIQLEEYFLKLIHGGNQDV